MTVAIISTLVILLFRFDAGSQRHGFGNSYPALSRAAAHSDNPAGRANGVGERFRRLGGDAR